VKMPKPQNICKEGTTSAVNYLRFTGLTTKLHSFVNYCIHDSEDKREPLEAGAYSSTQA